MGDIGRTGGRFNLDTPPISSSGQYTRVIVLGTVNKSNNSLQPMITANDSDCASEQLGEQPGERVRERETRELLNSLLTAYPQVAHHGATGEISAEHDMSPDERSSWRQLGECARRDGRASPVHQTQIVRLTPYGAVRLVCYCEGYLAECAQIRARHITFLPDKRER